MASNNELTGAKFFEIFVVSVLQMSKEKLDMKTPAKRGRNWTKTLYSVQEKIISDWKLMAKSTRKNRKIKIQK